MILLTVGTTMPFDELLKEADRLADLGFFGEPLLCQGGQSRYRIRNGEQFIGKSSISDLISQASFVITHGGVTVIELLMSGKLFVAFANPRAAGDHQANFLTEMCKTVDISWSRNVGEMMRLIEERRRAGPSVVDQRTTRASTIIRRLIRHE